MHEYTWKKQIYINIRKIYIFFVSLYMSFKIQRKTRLKMTFSGKTFDLFDKFTMRSK